MNSSDDSTDKALKKRFQQVFNDFEQTPSRSLKKRIWQQLPGTSTTRHRYVVLAVLLLLLIGGALYGPQRILTRPATHAQHKQLAHGQSYTESPQPQTQPATYSGTSVSGIAGLVIGQPDSSLTQATLRDETQPHNSVLAKKSAKLALPHSLQRPQVRIARLAPASNQVRSSSVVNQDNQSRGRKPTTRSEEQVNSVASTPIRALSESSVSDSVLGEDARATVQPMAIRPFRAPVYTITRPMVQLPQQSTEATAESRPVPLQWLASVSPLSTFQLMTIVNRPEIYVQQVNTPAAFSAPTWGYQVSGGVVWRQLAVQLMAGQLSSWAYYDVATNEYRIEPTGLNEYQVIRLGRSVVENRSLTMLGASLAKEYRLGKRPGRYAARFGGQGTYLPATGQTLLWGQAALTMGIPLTNAYSVQLGPTVQYGFSRLFSGDRQLAIHPFLVGMSLTIRPTGQPH